MRSFRGLLTHKDTKRSLTISVVDELDRVEKISMSLGEKAFIAIFGHSCSNCEICIVINGRYLGSSDFPIMKIVLNNA